MSRYGGVFTGSDGGGNINIAIIGVYLLIACCLAAILTTSSAFVFLGFGLLFIFAMIGALLDGGSTRNLCLQQQHRLLTLAIEQVRQEDFAAASESFGKARIYGPIPKRYLSEYSRVLARV